MPFGALLLLSFLGECARYGNKILKFVYKNDGNTMQEVKIASKRQDDRRIQSMDVLKLFAIFLVLWGHAIQFLTSHISVNKYWMEPVYQVIYSFHMPLFMIISGFFAVSAMKRNFFKMIASKFRQLLLPVICWCVICTVLYDCFSLHSLHDFWLNWKSYCLFNLWFLKSLFICYLLAYFCCKCGRYKIIAFIIGWGVTLVISFLPQIYERVQSFAALRGLHLCVMFPSFVFGMLLHRYMSIMKAHAKTVFVVSLCVFLAMLHFWNSDFFRMPPEIRLMFDSGDYTELICFIGRKLYSVVIGIFGSMTFISLACMAFARPRSGKAVAVMCDWGKYTLAIYILQSIILEHYMGMYIKFDGMQFALFNFVVAPAISFLVLVVCVYIAKLLMKNRIAAFMLFGQRFGNG
jgi:fucose 4-O-acetylase-like acetyltransferase